MPAPTAFTWHATDVTATTVEQQMANLWKQVTEQNADSQAVRTSILNLVVFTTNESEATRISKELRDCTSRHPSRTIILIADRHRAGSSLDAGLSVYCTSSSSGRPVCYEEITITGHGRVADHLASVVIPLLVAELPTYLWWPGQPPFGHRMFHRMLGVADQLVIDSAQFASPGDGLANIARLSHGRWGINDFNWGRLTPWREVIAQFFDGPTWVPYVHGIRSMRLEFGSGTQDYRRATAGLLLVLGWMASRLGWEPETTLEGLAGSEMTLTVVQGDRLIDIDIQFRDHGSRFAGRLAGIEVVSQPKELPPARFSVQRVEDLEHAHVSITVHEGTDIHRVVSLETKSEAQLLTDELELAGHDDLYDSVVEMASRLAGREIWIPV